MQLERIFIHRLVRALRLVVPLLVLASVAVPAWNYLSRQEEQAPPGRQLQELPQDLAVITKDITYSQTDGGRTLFTVRAKTNLGFKDSKSMLQDVDVTVFGQTEDEPTRSIRSKSCSHDQQTNDIHCTGDVRFELNEQTRGRTEELIYNPRDRIVTSNHETILEQPGSATARADSFEYALETGLVKLNGNVRVQTAEDASLEGASAVLHQKENWATVSGGIVVTSGRGWIRGASGRAELEAGSFKPRTIVIDGGVTAEARNRKSETWEMRAGWLEAAMSASGEVERVKARRGVQIEQVSGGPRQRLTGEEIDAAMNASGAITLIEARQDARMILGPDRELRSTTIRRDAAGYVETGGDSILQLADTRIEGANFGLQQGDIVKFATSQRASLRSGERQTSADRTEATFDSRTNSLLSLIQSGAFEFKDAQLQGRARNARFEEGGSVVLLDGAPVVTDSRMRMEAGQIRLNQKNNSFSASGNVKTVTTNSGDPVLVTASSANGAGEAIVYTGNVQLWRGNNTNIRSERLDISTKENRFHAEGKVDSRFELIRARSDKLDYDEKRNEVQYTGGVVARRQDMVLETQNMRVKLTGADRQVSEIHAFGGVAITRRGQRGKGDEAVYDARAETVTLTGKDAQVHDPERGTARGARLIMKTTGDTMAVEGGSGGRAVTQRPVARPPKK